MGLVLASVLVLLLRLDVGGSETTTTVRTTTPTKSDAPVQCPEGSFWCLRDKFCIPEYWACDGVNDCGDNSDEERCVQGQVLPSREEFFSGSSSSSPAATCSGDEFKCQDYNRTYAKCVPRSHLCNKVWDCTDGSDEGGFCNSCPRYACSHDCRENPILGPHCLCPNGFILAQDEKTCIDDDECLSEHPCNHACLNDSPGYHCICDTGFQLGPDQRSCTLRESGTRLYFSYNHNVLSQSVDNLETGARPPAEPLLSSQSSVVVGMALDGRNNRLVMSSTSSGHKGSIHVYSLDHSEPEKEKREEVLIENVMGLGNVAVDWLTGNIYFTATRAGEELSSAIGLCTEDGRFCHFLNLTGPALHRPRGLVLHPRRGLVFWSDYDTVGPRIEMAAMDGSERDHDFVHSKLEWPNALAIDYATEKLYWADAQYRLIESIDLHSRRRQIVVAHNVHHPYDLAVFDNKVYWTDWFAFFHLFCQMRVNGDDRQVTGLMVAELTAGGKTDGEPWMLHKGQEGELVYGIALEHEAYENKHLYDPCQLANCTHICTLIPERVEGRVLGSVAAQCLCPLGYELDPVEPWSCAPLVGAEEEESAWPVQAADNFRLACDTNTACLNGGTCLPGWKHRTACQCPPSFGGRFCEVDVVERARRLGLGLPHSADATWIVALAIVAVLLLLLGTLTGYYSRKWSPKAPREEKLLPRIPSVSFFRGSRTSLPTQAAEDRQNFVHLEDGHRHLDLDKVESFANPMYSGPEGGYPKRNASSPSLSTFGGTGPNPLAASLKSLADDSGTVSTIVHLCDRSLAYAIHHPPPLV